MSDSLPARSDVPPIAPRVDAHTGSDAPARVDEASRSASEHAILSLVLPGLGQFAQGRPIAGMAQLGTVAAYAASALALGGGRALLLAVLWNLWSALDAYRHDR